MVTATAALLLGVAVAAATAGVAIANLGALWIERSIRLQIEQQDRRVDALGIRISHLQDVLYSIGSAPAAPLKGGSDLTFPHSDQRGVPLATGPLLSDDSDSDSWMDDQTELDADVPTYVSGLPGPEPWHAWSEIPIPSRGDQ